MGSVFDYLARLMNIEKIPTKDNLRAGTGLFAEGSSVLWGTCSGKLNKSSLLAMSTIVETMVHALLH